MKPQNLIVLLVAGGLGLVAMFVVKNFIPPQQPQNENLTKVVMAKVDLQQGDEINPDLMLEVRDFPANYAPPEAINDPNVLKGRAVRYHILPGEVITEAKLAEKGSKGMEALLDGGQRAVAVPIQTDAAVAGFIRQGAIVDIIITVDSRMSDAPGAQSGDMYSKTILQGVKILAVNTQMQRGEGESDTQGGSVEHVTFLVDPDQAEKLIVASKAGQLSLTLRNSNDVAALDPRGVLIRDVLETTKSETPDDTEVPLAVMPDLTKIEAELEKMRQDLRAEMQDELAKQQKEIDLAKAELARKQQGATTVVVDNRPKTAPKVDVRLKDEHIKWLIYHGQNGDPIKSIPLDTRKNPGKELLPLLREMPHNMTREEWIAPESSDPASGKAPGDKSSPTPAKDAGQLGDAVQ